MTVFLRDAATGRFYAGPEKWESNRSGALAFSSVESAARCGRNQNRARLEVILAYDDPICDLVLPLGIGD